VDNEVFKGTLSGDRCDNEESTQDTQEAW